MKAGAWASEEAPYLQEIIQVISSSGIPPLIMLYRETQIKDLTLPEKHSECLPAALGGHTFYAEHFL